MSAPGPRPSSAVEALPSRAPTGRSRYPVFFSADRFFADRFSGARLFAAAPRPFFAAFFPGHPASIWAYASFDTVPARFGRLFPAFFRRLMFATSELFGAAFFFAFAAALSGAAAPFFEVLFAAAPLASVDPFLAALFRAVLARLGGAFTPSP